MGQFHDSSTSTLKYNALVRQKKAGCDRTVTHTLPLPTTILYLVRRCCVSGGGSAEPKASQQQNIFILTVGEELSGALGSPNLRLPCFGEALYL